MKYFRYHLKVNKKLLLYALVFSLCIDLIIIGADLKNVGIEGYWIPIIACLATTVVVMLFVLFLIYRISKKNEPVFDIMNEKGLGDELIAVYRQRNPKMTPMNHIVLASYLKVMDRLEEAEYEIAAAGSYNMVDVYTKAYYSESFIDLRILQRRFDEAIIMYNNYNSLMNAFCRSHKNNPLCVMHYCSGAVLYAYSGDFRSAMICIQSMDKPAGKTRKFAFSRNTALMGVYLIRGDLDNADNVKNMMLRDVEDFDGFDMKYEKQLVLRDIEKISKLFDPREQRG